MRTSTLLECDHTLYWSAAPPRNGERIYCHDCRDMRKVIAGNGAYYFRCMQCRYKAARITVERIARAARKHLEANPSHSLVMRQQGTDLPTRIITLSSSREPCEEAQSMLF